MVDAPFPFKILAAPFSPFSPEGELRLAQIGPYAEFLHREGIAGVFVCGTTGEGLSMTPGERRDLAEAWKAVLPADMELIVNVSHACLRDARELARHAQEIGADGVACHGSVFYPAAAVSSVVAQAAQIAEAAGDTPFYYYHIPSMTRVQPEASEFLPDLMREIPSFRGMKYTHSDLVDFGKCLEVAGRDYRLFFGRDEMLLSAMELGARAAVGSTYNFAARHYARLFEALQAGDTEDAEKIQGMCTEGISRMLGAGGLPAMKAIMAWCGVDCGPPRLPLEAPSASTLRILRAELEQLGFLAGDA